MIRKVKRPAGLQSAAHGLKGSLNTFGFPWPLNSLTAADRSPSRALARSNTCSMPGLVGDGRVEVS